MLVTIHAKDVYRVYRLKGEPEPQYALLKDGKEPVMLAEIRSYYDYQDEVKFHGNECAHACECFVTAKGNKWIYWRDEETDEDFLTLIERGGN